MVLAIGHRSLMTGRIGPWLNDRDAQLAWGSVQHHAVGGRSVPPMTVLTALSASGKTHPRIRGATLTNRGSGAGER